MRITLAILVLLSACFSRGATYYVRTSGNNSNPGSTGSPWRTIQKGLDATVPGDNVIVGDGDFNEHLTTKTNGVTLISENLYGAQFRAIRINNHTNVWVEGFRIEGFSDANNIEGVSWQGNIRLEISSDSATIVSNKFRSVYVKGMGFSHITTSNELRSAEVDFNAAGFTNGSHIYLGSCGLPGFYGTNHNIEMMVARISADGHSVLLTNGGGSNFVAEANTNLWIQAYAGNGSEGLYNIFAVRTGGNQPSNVVIRGNTFEDTFGPGIMAQFDSGLIESNYFGTNAGFRFIALQGSNLRVRGNIFANSHNLFRYTQDEVQNMAHPPGTAFFDHLSASISAFSAGSSNNVLEYNVWYDVENQLGLSDNYSDSSGLYYRSNIFVGVSEHYSGGRPDFRWEGNTFLRCAYTFGESIPLALGGSPPYITGLTITSNLFIDCGDHSGGDGTGSTEGFYTVSTNASSPLLDRNWIAGAEILGYAGKSTYAETNGQNGGNPVFRDISNPAGPDGIWFTDDDGLRPLPGSPVASRGWGALAAPPSSVPYAHFRVKSPTGWFEANSSATYDTNWLSVHPALRNGMQRDFRTPQTLGAAPVTVTLTLTNTWDGTGTGMTNITGVRVDWGDGASTYNATRFNKSEATHTFVTAGTNAIVLTVTNTAAQIARYTNSYRVSAPDGTFTNKIFFVDKDAGNNANSGTGSWAQAWSTLQKVGTNSLLVAGDIIAVKGVHTEWTDITKAGTESKPIRWLGFGVTNGGFRVRNPDHTFDGWYLNASNVPAADGVFRVYDIAHRTRVLNTTVTDHDPIAATNEVSGVDYEERLGFNHIRQSGFDEVGQSASSCLYSNVVATKLNNIAWSLYGSGTTLINVRHYLCNGQADFVRPHGDGHKVLWSETHDNSTIREEHSDVVQAFGIAGTSSPQMARNFIMANCIVSNFVGQLGQLETIAHPDTNYLTNIVIYGSILHTKDKISANINGLKIINCGFYRAPFGYPSIAVGGGTGDKDGSWGMRILGNVFYYAGDDPTNNQTGWYTVTTNSYGFRGDLTGDFNLAYPPKRLPPPSNNAQRWGSYPGHEVNGINGSDPLLIDPDNWNFRPQTNSPLLGASTNMTALLTSLGVAAVDLDGNPRPATGNWTIGPYELSSTGSSGGGGGGSSGRRVISSRVTATTIQVAQ